MLFSQFLGKVKNSYPTLTTIARSDFSAEHHMYNLSLALQLYEQYNGNIAYNTHTSVGDNAVIEEFIPELLVLLDKFYTSDQSDSSAPIVAKHLSDVFYKLCLKEPISPIQDISEQEALRYYR